MGALAYREFPRTAAGNRERKEFWLSPDGLELIAGWRREGETLEEIYDGRIGIAETTWRHWLAGSPELKAAVSQTDELVNFFVERALLKRALGYEAAEDTFELVEGEMRKVRTVYRHVPPDTKAALAWLYSRRGDRWRAQQDPRDATTDQIRGVERVLVAITSAAAEEDAGDGAAEVSTDGD